MITIGRPVKEVNGDLVSLKAFVQDDVQNINDWLTYTTSKEYGDCFCDEVCDAFVVAMLLPAIITKQKIKIDTPMSERLYHNIEHSVSTILKHVYVEDKRKAKVTEIQDGIIEIGGDNQLVTYNYQGKGIATGCSLGVDSMASYLTYSTDNCPPKHKLTHLTYFNAGAMGFHNETLAAKAYNKDLIMVKQFSDEVGLPLVCIESNVAKWYNRMMGFGQCAVMINMSVVLSMQKLFGKYYFASSFPIWEFRYDKFIMEYYETLLLPLLSTESTDLMVANPEMTRVAKEKMIIDNSIVQKYLYVCWKEIIANANPETDYAKNKDSFLNCTSCDKCLRTLLAIDIMGYIEYYKELFNIGYYYKVKDSYIARVIAKKNDDSFYYELYCLIKEYNYPITKKTRALVFAHKMCQKFSFLGRMKLVKRIYTHYKAIKMK